MKWVAAAGLSLIACVAAFVGGWVVGRTAPKTAGDYYGTPIAPAPADWTEWRYPNAQETGQLSTGNTTYGRVRVGGVQATHLTTPDPFDQVVAFYAQKLGQPTLITPTGGGGGNAIRVAAGGQEFAAWAATPMNRPGVKDLVVTYRTSTYALVIAVTRADAEKQTHVAISYLPNP